MKIAKNRLRAFSLVELIVVIAILAILMGLILSAVQNVRAAASRALCASQLRQWAIGVHGLESTRGVLPQGCEYPFQVAFASASRTAGLSWQTSVLPFVEQDSLWTAILATHRLDPSGELDYDHKIYRGILIPNLVCPSDGFGSLTDNRDRRIALTNFAGVAGTNHDVNDGVFHADYKVRMLDIADGASSTLMIGERVSGPTGERGGWYAGWGAYSTCPIAQILAAGHSAPLPTFAVGCSANRATFGPAERNNTCTLARFGSFHSGGANFAFADGSVRFLRYSAVDIIPDLATKAGGEPVANFD